MARQQAVSGAGRTGGALPGGRDTPMARQQAVSGARPRKRAGNEEERRLGAGLLVLGAGYLAAAFLITEPEGGYAAVGPRVFPIGIGTALAALGLRMALRANRTGGASDARPAPAGGSDAVRDVQRPGEGESDARPAPAGGSGAVRDVQRPGAGESDARPAPAGGSGGTSVPAGSPAPAADWRAAAPSALLFLAYVVLLEPAGYLPATTVFIALASRLLGSRRPGRDLLAAFVVTVSVHALFSLLLGLRLPAGFLGRP